MSRAEFDVIAERHRQISEEGWTPEHDDKINKAGDMSMAAAIYAANAASEMMADRSSSQLDGAMARIARRFIIVCWPWSVERWKPKDVRRDLVRAAALIIAEIERIDREKARKEARP